MAFANKEFHIRITSKDLIPKACGKIIAFISRATRQYKSAKFQNTRSYDILTLHWSVYVSGSGDEYSVQRSRPCNHVGRSKVIHRFGFVLERTTALDHTTKIYNNRTLKTYTSSCVVYFTYVIKSSRSFGFTVGMRSLENPSDKRPLIGCKELQTHIWMRNVSRKSIRG